jgi:hypothetical protein
MNVHASQHILDTAQSSSAALTALPMRMAYWTVEQFSERNPAFTTPALRNLIFKAETRQSSRGKIPGNGLIEAGAIVRIGRRVLIEEFGFFEWVRRQNEAMNADLKAVIAMRLDGRRCLFGRYPTIQAERIAADLRRMQMGAEVVDSNQVPPVPRGPRCT